jgi:glyoxylase-like metal-dependent hydrolase (beta-lactamase superfamily II)
MLRVHHLNCVSSCPIGGALMDGVSHHQLRGRLATHCLLLESGRSLVLVDTGYGLRDVHDPRSRLAKLFLAMLKPDLREELTAYRQIERLGFDPRDVQHIVLSHLDFDHAGGLDDFPHAKVHLLASELSSATERRTVIDRMRYRPQQWGTRANWQTHTVSAGERWFGFENVNDLPSMEAEVLMIPLLGHTLGHAGVAIRDANGWLFYAADAYFWHEEMDLQTPRCTPGLEAYQTLMEKNRRARLANRDRLRELKRAHGSEVTIFCAHDPHEFERMRHAVASPVEIATDVQTSSSLRT